MSLEQFRFLLWFPPSGVVFNPSKLFATMKSFVAVLGLIGAAAAAPQYLADAPDVAAAKVEFKATFDKVTADAAAALDVAGAVLEGSPAAEPYVHVDVPAELYVHEEPAVEAMVEPYVHVEVEAEPYVEVAAPAAEPAAPAALPVLPAGVLPYAGFYAGYAGYPVPFGFPVAAPCINNLGQAVPCFLPPGAPAAE